MVKAALSKDDQGRLRQYLRKTRNSAAFHYNYTDDLLKGYQTAFSEPLTQYNAHAYASLGDSFKETRFFFADAAVQRLYAGDESLDARFDEGRPRCLISPTS